MTTPNHTNSPATVTEIQARLARIETLINRYQAQLEAHEEAKCLGLYKGIPKSVTYAEEAVDRLNNELNDLVEKLRTLQAN